MCRGGGARQPLLELVLLFGRGAHVLPWSPLSCTTMCTEGRFSFLRWVRGGSEGMSARKAAVCWSHARGKALGGSALEKLKRFSSSACMCFGPHSLTCQVWECDKVQGGIDHRGARDQGASLQLQLQRPMPPCVPCAPGPASAAHTRLDEQVGKRCSVCPAFKIQCNERLKRKQ